MKPVVIYIEAHTSIVVGQSAVVVPLNHRSELVANGHKCITTPVVSIAADGTTFETRNTLYRLATTPAKESVIDRVVEHHT
jgi:peptidyl-tRNA hydrolase